MTPTVDLVHAGTGEVRDAALARVQSKPALSPVERQAVTTLVAGDATPVAKHVEERAAAYASGDPAVRRRALARAAAVHEAQMQELAALLAGAVARRDERAVKVLDRTLSSATARYGAMLDALRLECAPTRRIVAVAQGTIGIAVQEHG